MPTRFLSGVWSALSRQLPAVCALLSVLCVCLAQVNPQLEISVGPRQHFIDAEQRNDHIYYPLRDLAAVLGLELQERGGLLIVKGAVGRVRLIDGRPLVRSRDGYILLSAPVWKMSRDDWRVTEDFLTKALPLVVRAKLDKVSERRYRIEAKEENQVVVRVANYPDHVRIVFRSSRSIPVRLRDFDSHIAVEFGQYLVRPEFSSADPPDRRFVSSVEFDSGHAYGRFRIHKGTAYGSFRQFRLSAPHRNVVDVYGAPASTASSEVALAGPPRPPRDASTRPARPDAVPQRRITREPEWQDVITIDPGHGDEDYGVMSEEGDLEKTLTLAIANRIRDRVSANGYNGMLTRTRDVELGIEQRSSVGNYYGSQVYVSLHVAGAVSPEPGGPVVYVHKHVDRSVQGKETATAAGKVPEKSTNDDSLVPWEEGQKDYLPLSRQLARQIQNDLNFLWGTDNKVVEVPLAVLSPITAPAILIETGFLTNPEDRERLGSPEFQERLSRTIAFRVLRFVQTSRPAGSGLGMNAR